MVDEVDRWRQLCAQAAQEQDPDKLIELVSEIISILESKDIRPKSSPAPTTVSPPESEPSKTVPKK